MKTRIPLNAVAQPIFDLTYGSASVYQGKWSFYTITAILLEAVEAGFATVEIIEGNYGRTHYFRANDGQLIHQQYTDYTRGFDTWNRQKLPTGITSLSKVGVYQVTAEDVEAAILMQSLPSLY